MTAPCPFCGDTEALKIIALDTTKGEPWKTIKCIVCGAQGPIAKEYEAVSALWGKRFQPEVMK